MDWYLTACIAGHRNFSAYTLVVSDVYESMTDSDSINEEENLFLAYANSGHLVSGGDQKPQVLSKLMKLEGDLVSDFYSAKTLGPCLMEGRGKSFSQVSLVNRHVNFLALTFSCLYNEVLHEGKSPRHLYIFLEAWLETNKLIIAWQVAELK